MATSGPTNLPAYFSTDADFRTWGSTISAAIASVGLIQTSDTGQINWTTVSKPGSGAANQGYEIWRFADSLQGAAPIYFRIAYGSGSSANLPAVWFSSGQGTNGAGTLTGNIGQQFNYYAVTSKSPGVLLPMYCSGDSGQLFLAINVDLADGHFGFYVGLERPKDNANVPQSIGAVQWGGMYNTFTEQYIPVTGSVPSYLTSQHTAINPYVFLQSSAGANADACPFMLPIKGAWYYSHLLALHLGDFPAGGTMTCNIFGGTHTYLALDDKISFSFLLNNQSAGIAIPWE